MCFNNGFEHSIPVALQKQVHWDDGGLKNMEVDILVRKRVDVCIDFERIWDIYLENEQDSFNDVWNQLRKDSKEIGCEFPERDDVECLVDEVMNHLAHHISIYFKETNQDNPNVTCVHDYYITYSLAEHIVDTNYDTLEKELYRVGLKKFGVSEEV